jgi:hypothetical protein
MSERLKSSRNDFFSNIPFSTQPSTPCQMMLDKNDAHSDKMPRSDETETNLHSSNISGVPILQTSDFNTVMQQDKQYCQDNEEEKQRHCRFWFPHGASWTTSTILLSVASLVLSIFAMKSVDFAHLGYPVSLGSDFLSVDSVGLVKLQLCLNATEATVQQRDEGLCRVIILSTEQDDDRLWIFARTVACLAVAFGFFLTAVVTSSICWDTINFKPIAIFYFVVYLFQSLTFFFFASELCQAQVCSFGSGAFYSSLATFLWMTTCFVCIRMDVAHLRKLRKRATSPPYEQNSSTESSSTATKSDDQQSSDDSPA